VTFCSGIEAHFFCFECANRYAAEMVGSLKSLFSVLEADSRFELKCMDGSGCMAPFSEGEVQRFLDEKTFSCLDKLRTDHVINTV
jgi:hypothetical protein